MTDTTQNISIEAKYPYWPRDESAIRRFLDARFSKDKEFPEDRINSIYYDTRERVHLSEKIDSDFHKTKVRLRWYGISETMDPNQSVDAFLEVKVKQGARRFKQRKPVQLLAGMLSKPADSIHELQRLAVHARELGWEPRGQLFPGLVIRYNRARYIDEQGKARLALDRAIECECINPLLWPRRALRRLELGVLEVKNETGALPLGLLPIRERFGMCDSFSKYEESWRSLTLPFHKSCIRTIFFD